jgi:hypothetical protein
MELELVPNAVGAPPPKLAGGNLDRGKAAIPAGMLRPPVATPSVKQQMAVAAAAPAPRAATPVPAFQETGRAIDRLFHRLVSEKGSDLHLSSNETPIIRKDGDMQRLAGEAPLSTLQLFELLDPIIP